MDDRNPFPDKVRSTIEHVHPPHEKSNDSASESTYKPSISYSDVSVAFPESAQSSSINISMDNAPSTVVSDTMSDMIFSDPSNAGSSPEPLCKFVFKSNLVMVPNDDGTIATIRDEKVERRYVLKQNVGNDEGQIGYVKLAHSSGMLSSNKFHLIENVALFFAAFRHPVICPTISTGESGEELGKRFLK